MINTVNYNSNGFKNTLFFFKDKKQTMLNFIPKPIFRKVIYSPIQYISLLTVLSKNEETVDIHSFRCFRK